jgi:hypothetical protein
VDPVAGLNRFSARLPRFQGQQRRLELRRGVAAGYEPKPSALASGRAVGESSRKALDAVRCLPQLDQDRLRPGERVRKGYLVIPWRLKQNVQRFEGVWTAEARLICLVITAAGLIVGPRSPDLVSRSVRISASSSLSRRPPSERGSAASPSIRARCNSSSRTTRAWVASHTCLGSSAAWFCTSRAMAAFGMTALFTATTGAVEVLSVTVRMSQSSPMAG